MKTLRNNRSSKRRANETVGTEYDKCYGGKVRSSVRKENATRETENVDKMVKSDRDAGWKI